MSMKTGLFNHVFATKRFFFLIVFGYILTARENHDDVLSLVNAVQKRYYVIRRLEGSFETLMASYRHMCGSCLKRGCSLDKELNNVNKLWQDFLAYKAIMGDTHTRELLIHLIVLYEALFKTCAVGQSRSVGIFQNVGDLIEEVDFLAATSKGLLDQQKLHSVSQLLFPEIEQDLFFAAESEYGVEPDDSLFERLDTAYQRGEFMVNTTVRFYMIQRIIRSMDGLLKLNSCLRPDFHNVLRYVVADGMKSAVTRNCMERLRNERSMRPLEDLWQKFSSYRYIGDSYVIRECLIIVVHLYQLLMRYISPDVAQDAASEEEVISLYTSISSLPLPELLSLLDELTEQSSTLVSVYQQGVEQGWQTTLKHFWWVPPVLIAGCASLYLRIKKLLGHTNFRPRAEAVTLQTSV